MALPYLYFTLPRRTLRCPALRQVFANRARYWLPNPTLNNEVKNSGAPSTISSQTFLINESIPWFNGRGPYGTSFAGDNCTGECE